MNCLLVVVLDALLLDDDEELEEPSSFFLFDVLPDEDEDFELESALAVEEVVEFPADSASVELPESLLASLSDAVAVSLAELVLFEDASPISSSASSFFSSSNSSSSSSWSASSCCPSASAVSSSASSSASSSCSSSSSKPPSASVSTSKVFSTLVSRAFSYSGERLSKSGSSSSAGIISSILNVTTGAKSTLGGAVSRSVELLEAVAVEDAESVVGYGSSGFLTKV